MQRVNLFIKVALESGEATSKFAIILFQNQRVFQKTAKKQTTNLSFLDPLNLQKV